VGLARGVYKAATAWREGWVARWRRASDDNGDSAAGEQRQRRDGVSRRECVEKSLSGDDDCEHVNDPAYIHRLYTSVNRRI
jgi:hypothetical protein